MSAKKLYLINASLLKLTDCCFQVDLIHNKGLFTEHNNFKMNYGTAFHHFKYLYDSNKPLQECINDGVQWFLGKCLSVPQGDFRDIDHLIRTIKGYINFYPRDEDLLKTEIAPSGDMACEVSFAWPLNYEWFERVFKLAQFDKRVPSLDLINEWLSNKYEIVLCGTIDRKCFNRVTNERCFADTKVTSLWSKENFLESFQTNNQLKFYSYVQRLSGVETTWLPGLIDGVFIKKASDKEMNKTTRKFEPSQGFNGATFQRSRLFEFSDEVMEQFELWLFNRICRIMQNDQYNNWEQNFNRCETVYGSCDFSPICRVSKQHHDSIINGGTLYQRREYDPTRFQD